MGRNIVINSSIAFILASLLEMTLHEGGHFVASLAQGGHAVLHHNYVHHDDLSDTARIISAIAGPIVSLVIGVVFHLLLNTRRYSCILALFMLYMCIFGYVGFFGYVFIAPFFSYGDTGFVLRAIGCPMWGIITLAVLSVGVLWMLGRAWSVHVIALMSKETADDFQKRKQFIYRLMMFPLFIGLAVTTLLNLPVPTTLSLIAPLTSPYVILWPFGYYLRDKGEYYDENEGIAQGPWWTWVALMLVMIVINRLLVPGVGM